MVATGASVRAERRLVSAVLAIRLDRLSRPPLNGTRMGPKAAHQANRILATRDLGGNCMNATLRRAALRWLAAGAGLAVVSYLAHIGSAWCRFGCTRPATASEADALLDRFMPHYDVVERHHVRVSAPAAVVLSAAQDQDLLGFLPVHAIIKARETLLGARPEPHPQPRGLLPQMLALGWAVLAHVRGVRSWSAP
jgi:hypothetical protein